MKAIHWSLEYRSLLLNLLFGGYLLFLRPSLLQRLGATRGYSIPDPFIGSLLLLLPFFELAGIYLKRPVFAYYFKLRFPDYRSLFQNSRIHILAVVGGSLSLFFGMLLTIVLTLVVLEMLGAVISPGPFLFVAFVAIIFKAWSVGMLWYGASFGEIGIKAPKQISTELVLRDLLGDMLLLLYAAVGYTALWDANPFFSESARGNRFFESFFPGTAWGNDLFAALYFLSVYIFLRGIYLVQDVFLGNRTVRLWSFLSFVVLLVIAMLSVPQR